MAIGVYNQPLPNTLNYSNNQGLNFQQSKFNGELTGNYRMLDPQGNSTGLGFNYDGSMFDNNAARDNMVNLGINKEMRQAMFGKKQQGNLGNVPVFGSDSAQGKAWNNMYTGNNPYMNQGMLPNYSGNKGERHARNVFNANTQRMQANASQMNANTLQARQQMDASVHQANLNRIQNMRNAYANWDKQQASTTPSTSSTLGTSSTQKATQDYVKNGSQPYSNSDKTGAV